MRKTRILLTVGIVCAIALGMLGSLGTRPVDAPGNGPPDIEKLVFVHYPKDRAPARPPWAGGGGGGGEDREACNFSYKGDTLGSAARQLLREPGQQWG
ncbi:MAG: hypothetical protein ABIH46_09360 [Chloroflexota bacterium]